MIHHDGTHSNQNIITDRTSMDQSLMSHIYRISYRCLSGLISTMYDGTILYISMITNANTIDIAANYCVEPNRAIGIDYYISHNGRILCQKAAFIDDGQDALDGQN